MMFVIRDALSYCGLIPDKKMKKEVADTWSSKLHNSRLEFFTERSKILTEFTQEE